MSKSVIGVNKLRSFPVNRVHFRSGTTVKKLENNTRTVGKYCCAKFLCYAELFQNLVPLRDQENISRTNLEQMDRNDEVDFELSMSLGSFCARC